MRRLALLVLLLLTACATQPTPPEVHVTVRPPATAPQPYSVQVDGATVRLTLREDLWVRSVKGGTVSGGYPEQYRSAGTTVRLAHGGEWVAQWRRALDTDWHDVEVP